MSDPQKDRNPERLAWLYSSETPPIAVHDAEFWEVARGDVLYLLAEVARLREALEAQARVPPGSSAAKRIALQSAPEETARGRMLCSFSAAEVCDGTGCVTATDNAETIDVAECPTREDAERIAAWLRAVGERVKP